MMHALLEAVANKIASLDGVGKALVDVRDDGRPPATAGEWFYSVHAGDMIGNATECIDVTFPVLVTISRRAGFTPNDRVGQEVIRKARTGMYARIWAVIEALHGQWDYMIPASDDTTANGIIGATEQGFCETLAFETASKPREVDGSWFAAEGAGAIGYESTLTFAKARIVKPIGG